MLFVAPLVRESPLSFVASTDWKSTKKGKIVVDGIELTENLKNIEQIRRNVGMVFQHFNLFPT